MFGWPMEEEAKLAFTITVNWRREDGTIATTQLATVARGACRSAEDVGLQLADAKPILGRLQEIVVSEQLQRYCETVRPCPRCHLRRRLKDYRRRRFDTVFGRLAVGAESSMPVTSFNTHLISCRFSHARLRDCRDRSSSSRRS